MAIQKYKVEVTRVDEYEIEIDDAIYTDEFIEQWSESFFETDEGSRKEDFAKHLAGAITSGGKAEPLDGFGYVKQKFHSSKEGDLLFQVKSGMQKVTEEDYSPGLFVNIISYDDDYQTEIFES
ncbi:hypothetical protein AB9T89_10315 [Flavobacterium oncorhynchi]|uniref:hypothetical protein n=1 Tax=Flavobacterium oncorhynchi TaxID=728056 RepID=UPI00351A0A6B